MSDRDFWIAIRAALLAIVAVIERKHIGGSYQHQKVSPSDTITTIDT